MRFRMWLAFVAAYFPTETKQRYVTLVEAIRTAYGERIDRLTWMSEAARPRIDRRAGRFRVACNPR